MYDEIKKLQDISMRIQSIFNICAKFDDNYEALEDYEISQPAIMMHIIVCNEDIDKLMYSENIDIKSILSNQELKGIRAIRNIAAHDYEGLDFSIINDIIAFYLPKIKDKIDNFLILNNVNDENNLENKNKIKKSRKNK